jgi:signal transduction histidine kinase
MSDLELQPEDTEESTVPSHHFVVDSGLKDIIGQELITNDFVAVYELVKNSLDAHASKVDILIEQDRIVISDNGKGMLVADGVDEVKDKWLRVAYSAKKQGTEDDGLSDDFRKKIAEKRRTFGGNKGVGRFSCDRLGGHLDLYTKTPDQSEYSKLEINWQDFEAKQLVKFEDVELARTFAQSLPSDLVAKFPDANTVLIVSILRNDWGYAKLQSLKKELAQLINPFEDNLDIEINIKATHFENEDAKQAVDFVKVNGPVSNNIYKLIGLSTTKIEVSLKDKKIISKLIDRGELIYEISEDADYEHIKDIPIKVDFSFLNRAAKSRFTKFMGITALQFGHVFLFKNGYRVMPYGIRGNDILGYDARKLQGTRRFLGSRDLLGQINIQTNTSLLNEPSSRDGGLIRNEAYAELEEFVLEKVLKRLEAYIVGITFGDNTDKDREDASGLKKEKARIGVIELINRLTKSKAIEVLKYHSEIVNIIDEKSQNFVGTIKNLKQIASASSNDFLLEQIKSAEAKFEALKKAKDEAKVAEAEARRVAAEETAKANAALQAQRYAEAAQQATELELQVETRRSLFLKSLTEVDVEDIIGLNHQIVYDAGNVKNIVNDAIERVTLDEEHFNGSVALQILQGVSLSNQKILLASKFATSASFQHRSDGITQDMVAYLRDYIEVSVRPNALNIDVVFEAAEDLEFVRTFKPLELSIVVDNLVSNAQKSQVQASQIIFHAQKKDEKLLITVSDNGRGLVEGVDISRIFDLGYSGTGGSGIGLYHIKSTLKLLNGSIKLVKTNSNEAKFQLEIMNENQV